MGKKIAITFGVIFVLLIAGVLYVASNLDSIVKDVIEDQGSAALDTPVRVGSVSVALTDGAASISGLRIGNPDGFDSDYAVSLGSISASLDIASLNTDVIRITNVDVADAHIVAEQRGGRLNLKALLDGLPESSGTEEANEADESGKQVIIDRFTLTNPTLDLVGFGDYDTTIEMGDVRVNNIGSSTAGAEVADAAQQLLSPILAAAIERAARGALKEKLLGEDGEAEQLIKDKLGELLGRGRDED